MKPFSTREVVALVAAYRDDAEGEASEGRDAA